MQKMNRTSRSLKVSAVLIAGFFVVTAMGCAGTAMPRSSSPNFVVNEGPLGGAALEQRKHELDRAYRDLVHIHRTMQSLIDRKDGRALSELDRFVDRYMGIHLEPLLRAEWQSSHPELMARDAGLRFVNAEVLIQMRYPRRVQEIRDEIERRFLGHHDLLIEYPIGEQGTIGDALQILADRKWKG